MNEERDRNEAERAPAALDVSDLTERERMRVEDRILMRKIDRDHKADYERKNW